MTDDFLEHCKKLRTRAQQLRQMAAAKAREVEQLNETADDLDRAADEMDCPKLDEM